MSVLPLLKFAKPKCGGSGFPKPDSGGGVGGVQAPHTVPRECAYFRPFFPWAVPFAQLL